MSTRGDDGPPTYVYILLFVGLMICQILIYIRIGQRKRERQRQHQSQGAQEENFPQARYRRQHVERFRNRIEREAEQRQQALELADQSATADPILPPSNFIAQERNSLQNNTILSMADLHQIILAGTIVRKNGWTQHLLGVDFGTKHEFVVLDPDDDHCIICLETWENGDRIGKPPNCCHVFHSDCIDSWMKGSNECPSCRGIVRPVGCLVSEDDLEAATTPTDVELTQLEEEATMALGVRGTSGRNNLFPSFLPFEQRYAFLEDLLNCGQVIRQSDTALEVIFSGSDVTVTLPATDCLLCSRGWSPGATIVQSENPSCQHYFHHACIIDHLLFHPSAACPSCQGTFVSADGQY